MTIFLIFLLVLLVSSALTLLSLFLSKLSLKYKTFNTPFECGFNSMNSPRTSFSIQFFLIGTLFLVFDIEIVLLLPFPIIELKNLMMQISLFTVIFILILGLIYEWQAGALKWM